MLNLFKKKTNNQPKKPVEQYKNGKLIKTYESVCDVAIRNKKFRKSHISECCNGKRKLAYGYEWKFKEYAVDPKDHMIDATRYTVEKYVAKENEIAMNKAIAKLEMYRNQLTEGIMQEKTHTFTVLSMLSDIENILKRNDVSEE